MPYLGEHIVVVGCAGSGKSTLASKLGKLIGIPVVHLDREFWNPGWVETPQDKWMAKVPELIAGDKWIVDGNYAGTLDIRLERANTVIFLDFNRFVCLYSVIKRIFENHGRTRPDMAHGCPEKVDWEFISWMWGYNRKIRPEMLEKISSFDGNVIFLKNRKQVNAFLRGIQSDTSLIGQ